MRLSPLLSPPPSSLLSPTLPLPLSTTNTITNTIYYTIQAALRPLCASAFPPFHPPWPLLAAAPSLAVQCLAPEGGSVHCAAWPPWPAVRAAAAQSAQHP